LYLEKLKKQFGMGIVVYNIRPVRLAYQPLANSTFLSEQIKPATSNQPPVLFSQNKSAPAMSHQPNEQADYSKENVYFSSLKYCNSVVFMPHVLCDANQFFN
jgi:hypothetical protein